MKIKVMGVRMRVSPLLLLSFACGIFSLSAHARVLKSGDKGEDVRKWQVFLINRLLMQPPALGNFAERTKKATQAFQKQHGLKLSSVLDTATEKKAKSIGFVAYTGTKNRTGTYVNTTSEIEDGRKRASHNTIELKSGGVVILRTTGRGSWRGKYKLQGDIVKFQFPKKRGYYMMGDDGVFNGTTLYTHISIKKEGEDDPGDYNPERPDGYPHKKR